MSPTTLKALGALFAAIAVVLNAAAAGTVDPVQIGEAIFAVASVVAIVEGAVKSHADKPAIDTHPTPTATGGA